MTSATPTKWPPASTQGHYRWKAAPLAHPPLDGLDRVLQRVEELRTVLFGEAGIVGLTARRCLAQMPVQFAHAQRHADALLGEWFAGWPQNRRAFREATRRQ